MNKYLYILCLGLILFSCRTKKEISDLERRSFKDLSECVTTAHALPEWFSAKISTDVSFKGEDNSFTSSLRMKKDSLIWISIRKGPYVIATVIITPDSVKAAIKTNKTYFETDIKYLQRTFGVDVSFTMLQDLLLGNPVAFDPDDRYKKLDDTTYYVFSTHSERQIERAYDKLPRREEKQYIQRYWIRSGDCKMHRTLINQLADTSNLEIINHDYKSENDLLFPNKVTVIGDNPRDTIQIEFNYSRYKVDKELRFPYKVGDNYTKLSL